MQQQARNIEITYNNRQSALDEESPIKRKLKKFNHGEQVLYFHLIHIIIHYVFVTACNAASETQKKEEIDCIKQKFKGLLTF